MLNKTRVFFAALLLKYRYVFLIYIGVALVFFGKLFLMRGMVLGGDWGNPATDIQTENTFASSLYTWAYSGNPFGTRPVTIVSLLFSFPLRLALSLGISSELFPKIFLVITYALAGANFNLLMKKLGVKAGIALVGGLAYITTPIFFNYSLMGWLFALLSMALLPLFVYLYLQAIEKDKQNRVVAPYTEIVVDIRLPQGRAA